MSGWRQTTDIHPEGRDRETERKRAAYLYDVKVPEEEYHEGQRQQLPAGEDEVQVADVLNAAVADAAGEG